VFGDRENWVDQLAHPFLEPAAEATQGEAGLQIIHAIELAVEELAAR
jgi:hypothetical protein